MNRALNRIVDYYDFQKVKSRGQQSAVRVLPASVTTPRSKGWERSETTSDELLSS